MIKIAVIQFPGINTEYETRREINKAGMHAEFFRWNDDREKLKRYQGYVIGGGFAYEDRGRAGIIAALDPVMDILKEETAPQRGGKPLIGICNGCQIGVETGMVPASDEKVLFAMARNKRVKDGEVLGTGYYNDWVYLRNTAPKGRTAFTQFIEEGELITCPVAHGEGKFTTTVEGLLDKLIKNRQIVFRYCDKNGAALNEFPVNPNGSLWNIAAVCNPEGNVMVIMPHFERSEESQTFFLSMKAYIENGNKAWEKAKKVHFSLPPEFSVPPQQKYSGDPQSIQLLVSLIITDNEADTFQSTLKRLGFGNVTLQRQTHFEVNFRDIRTSSESLQKFARKIIQSGLLMNTNKETATVVLPKERISYSNSKQKFFPAATEEKPENEIKWLIRDKQDFVGLSKEQAFRGRLGMEEITGVKKGTLWRIKIDSQSENTKEKILRKLMKMHIFANPHSQQIMIY